MSYPRGQYYWVNFGLDDPAKQQEAPLDALGQWQGKTKAVVEWDFREKRLPNNRVVHYAIPILTCRRYYGPRGLGAAGQFTEDAIRTWLGQRGETLYKLDYQEHNSHMFPHAQFNTGGISCISELNYLPVAACQGQGYTQKEAQKAAARLLFNEGYCTYYGQFNSRPRNLIY